MTVKVGLIDVILLSLYLLWRRVFGSLPSFDPVLVALMFFLLIVNKDGTPSYSIFSFVLMFQFPLYIYIFFVILVVIHSQILK